MAQVINPTTGELEEEDTLDPGFSGVTSGPSVSGTSMQPSLSDPGFFSGPNGLAPGYQWMGGSSKDPAGYTRQYADPYATSYNMLDPTGKQLGGLFYDDVKTATQKMAYTTGRSQTEDGQWTHSFYGAPKNSLGLAIQDPEAPPQRSFANEAELYDAFINAPGAPGRFDSREKYGRQPIEQQYNNVLSAYNSGQLKGEVPDWTYHRTAGGPEGNFRVSGDKALYGYDALVGPDGNIVGRRINANPGSMVGADTSGKVQSSMNMQRLFNPNTKDIVRDIGNDYGFLAESDTGKFGFNDTNASTYSKASGGFMSKIMPIAMAALAIYTGGAAAGLWGAGAGVGGAAGVGAGALAGEAAGASTLGSLGSGLSGVAVPALNLSGAPAAGILGTGLSGTAASTLGWTSGLGEALSLGGVGLDSIAGSGGSGLSSLFETPGFSGADFLGGGGNNFTSLDTAFGGNGAFNATPDSFAYPESLSNASSSIGEVTDPFDTIEGVNEGYSRLDGYGADNLYGKGASGLPIGTEGEIKNMLNQLFDPIGGKRPGIFQAPSPANLVGRGVNAFMDYRSNQDAMKMYEDQLEKMRGYVDPNRARGDFANTQWQKNVQDPETRFREWMNGAGGIMRDQMAAKGAAGGRRGGYMNSGRMETDLRRNSLADQDNYLRTLQGGFSAGNNNEAEIMKYMAPLAGMERNRYAPFGQAIGGVARDFALSEMPSSLSSLFGWG